MGMKGFRTSRKGEMWEVEKWKQWTGNGASSITSRVGLSYIDVLTDSTAG